jgi:Ser/Thr protein kinase RdoA (MazF antagonist)
MATPKLPLSAAEAFVRDHYGIEARAEALTGERDENFWLRTPPGPDYVLKVCSPGESPEIASLQIAVLRHVQLTDPDLPCPRVMRSKDDRFQLQLEWKEHGTRTAFLCTFMPGKLLLSSTRSREQQAACGRLLARLGRALKTFEHAASRRELVWDLRHLPKLQALCAGITNLPKAQFIAGFLEQFTAEISPRLSVLRRQFVHNDFNARNILVDPADEARITGVIDFGDSVHTALVADVAVGVIGQLATPEHADDAIREFVGAYCEVEPLTAEELDILKWLIAGRIVQNVVMISWHRAQNPSSKHFDGFDAAYFEWRLALAQRLVSPVTRST